MIRLGTTPCRGAAGALLPCSRRWTPRRPEPPMTERQAGGPNRVPSAVSDLLASASLREPIADAAGKSGASLERLVIDGRPYVLQHLDLADDWAMRASGCVRGVPLVLWERGILDRLPGCLNQPIVGVVREEGTGNAPSGGCAGLMHDVSQWLVPVDDESISPGQHPRLLEHMAGPPGRCSGDPGVEGVRALHSDPEPSA